MRGKFILIKAVHMLFRSVKTWYRVIIKSKPSVFMNDSVGSVLYVKCALNVGYDGYIVLQC